MDPITGGLISGGISLVNGLFGGGAEKKAAKLADARFREGRDFVANKSDTSQVYAPGGAKAFTAEQNLLGLGDSQAGQQSFNDYLNSTGFQSQLKAGTDAITGNAAARGLLKSGATLKRLNQYGTGLARQGFEDYLANLRSVATRGQQAAGSIDNAYTGAAAGSANALQTGYSNAGRMLTSGIEGAVSDIGTGFGLGKTWGS